MKLWSGQALRLWLIWLSAVCRQTVDAERQGGHADTALFGGSDWQDVAEVIDDQIRVLRDLQDETSDTNIFPCPVAEDILPCVCTAETQGLKIDCSAVTSADELASAFQADFAVKDCWQFYMRDNDAITELRGVFNGVTFQEIELYGTKLELVTVDAFEASHKTLQNMHIEEGLLDAETFPLQTLQNYTSLERLYLRYQQFTWLPPLSSQTLRTLIFWTNNIASLASGTLDDLPNLSYTDLSGNSLTVLEPGTFHLVNAGNDVLVFENQLSTVHPGAFVLPVNTSGLGVHLDMSYNQLTTVDQAVYGALFPFLTHIHLEGNPLSCGCDIAWLVLDPLNMSKIITGASCAGGELLEDLDPDYFEQEC